MARDVDRGSLEGARVARGRHGRCRRALGLFAVATDAPLLLEGLGEAVDVSRVGRRPLLTGPARIALLRRFGDGALGLLLFLAALAAQGVADEIVEWIVLVVSRHGRVLSPAMRGLLRHRRTARRSEECSEGAATASGAANRRR